MPLVPAARTLLAALGMLWLAAPAPAAGDGAAGPPDYFLVVTGGELLDGQVQDGHTPFLTRTLRPLGLRCAGALLVDDQHEEMLAALRFATNAAPLVLVTGGLGPTPNDITRETLSAFTGIPLRESEAAVSELERRFRQPRDQLRPNLRRQCLVPERGGFFPNPHGTAAGLHFEAGPVTLVALPGPPRELQPMVREALLPWLQRRYGLRPAGASLTLRFVGVGQSQISQTLEDRVGLPPDVQVTSLFEGSRVDFTFHLPGVTEADQTRLRRLGDELRRYLGEFCYAEGETSLESAVLRALHARGLRLTLAEVATGGGLAAALSSAVEAPSVLGGMWAAPGEGRLAALLETTLPGGHAGPEERVRALARAAATRGGTPAAVVVGETTETDGTLSVGLAYFDGGQTRTRTLPLDRGTTASDRARLVTAVLDALRRWQPAP